MPTDEYWMHVCERLREQVDAARERTAELLARLHRVVMPNVMWLVIVVVSHNEDPVGSVVAAFPKREFAEQWIEGRVCPAAFDVAKWGC